MHQDTRGHRLQTKRTVTCTHGTEPWVIWFFATQEEYLTSVALILFYFLSESKQFMKFLRYIHLLYVLHGGGREVGGRGVLRKDISLAK